MKRLTHLDLFSGIGGFALAAKWAGFETIAFCEIDDYAQKVLSKNFGAIMADTEKPRTGQNECGIRQRTCGVGRRQEPSRIFPDITKLDGKQFRGVSLLTAGVPCQPASVAGKRGGASDDRWLWPEALRVFGECLPTWAIFENPPGILSLDDGVEFERVLSAVESFGYTVQPIGVPACAVDARHRRMRIWIVAHANDGQCDREAGQLRTGRNSINPRGENVAHADELQSQRRIECSGDNEAGLCGEAGTEQAPVPDANGNRQRRGASPEQIRRQRSTGEDGSDGVQGGTQWPAESGFCRISHGVPNRVHRLRGLGNSIVPQVAYQILKLMA